MTTVASNPYIFLDDIANGQENVKISFVNDKNNQNISHNVTYTPNNILSSNALIEDFESIPCPCKCEEFCDNSCTCALGANIAYKNGLLSENFMQNVSKPIVECSDLCTCDSNCSNKIVQKGIKFHLQVFLTENKGFGVRTIEHIPNFAFVCEYAGELIDKAEADKRLRDRANEPNYVFILKEHSFDHSHISTVIDPTHFGNVGRYLNHSCSPNLFPVPVRVDSMLPRICFFAKSNIEPYEELTYNYGIDPYLTEGISSGNAAKAIQTLKTCHCHSSVCLGVLPFDAKSLS